MTEREYIDIQEETLVGEAIATLSKIIPANSKVIPVSGLAEMIKQLRIWEYKLGAEIKIK